MKEYKTIEQQLEILRSRKLVISDEKNAKEFLERENYYNVVNGYKDLFLRRGHSGNIIKPEEYIPETNFNELKSLFLFDRDLRILFLKYVLIFENNFKSILAHEFSKKYPQINAYLNIQNYTSTPKKVLKQISIITSTIHDKIDKEATIKHYIEKHNSVPFWVLVNYLTIGNLANIYGILKDGDKNTIAKKYSDKFKSQYSKTKSLTIHSKDLEDALKIINLVRNKCAHDERLYNYKFGSIRISTLAKYFKMTIADNEKLVVIIVYLKVLLTKDYFIDFYNELESLFKKYEKEFSVVSFKDILHIMGIDLNELKKLE